MSPNDPTSPTCSRGPRISPLGVLITHGRALLAGLFLLAAYNKLAGTNGPQLFSGSVQAFFKLKDAAPGAPSNAAPDWFVRLSTGVVPWTEVIAATLLLCGVWTRAAASVLALLLLAFIVLIVQAIARDLDLHCGCFGKLSPFCPDRVGPCNIVQNAIMLAIALIIIVTPPHKLTRPANPTRPG